MISTALFLAALPPDGGNPFFLVAGFHLALLRFDFMHTAFLGIFQITVANMVWELLEAGHFCPTTAASQIKLDAAFGSLVVYCKRHGLSLFKRRFSVETFGKPSDTNHPELASKAHDCRVMVSWIEGQTKLAADRDTDHGTMRYGLAWSQLEVCKALEESPRYLEQRHLTRILQAMDTVAKLYVALHEAAAERGEKRWKLIRKIHPWMHLMQDMEKDMMNCRCYSCWTDESMMNLVVRMVRDQDNRGAISNVFTAWWPSFVERALGSS